MHPSVIALLFRILRCLLNSHITSPITHLPNLPLSSFITLLSLSFIFMSQHPLNPMASTPSSHQDPSYHNRYRSTTSHPPQHPPNQPFSLSDSDIALLSQSYSDFFAPLRSNTFACQWIFQWLLTSTPIDISALNLSLSRAYRSVYMCATRACASIDSQTLLQKSSTLLLPVQSSDSVVVGYYVASSTDQSSSESVRMGKYVYNSSTRALFKVSKVRGPPSSSGLLSICINRTNIVGNGMFVKDYVMVSFPWQADTTAVPSQSIVHSRTLAFHKLVQTAQQAGLAGHASLSDGRSQDSGVSESSFYGLGTFGVYESVLVPSPLCSGMRAEGSELSLSIGTWAVPEHYAFCRGHRFLHMGMFREELASLHSHFMHAYGQPTPLPSRYPADPPPSFDDNAQTVRPRAHQQHSQPVHREREQRSAQPVLGYSQHPVGYDNRVATDFEYDKDVQNTSVSVHNTAPATAALPINRPRHGSVLNDATTDREITVDTMATTLPLDIPTSVMLPMQRLATSSQTYHPVEHTLQEVPSAVVDSIEAVVSAQPPTVPQTSPQKRNPVPTPVVTSPVAGNVGTNTSIATNSLPTPGNTAPRPYPTPVTAKPTGSENTPPQKKEQSFSMQSFKKTLPAPTKSEIVIRNRISAQRSNEKRRRRIEATRTELAYLKTTYLPQLKNRKGSLTSENQTLKLKFMEKYHENDIESFF